MKSVITLANLVVNMDENAQDTADSGKNAGAPADIAAPFKETAPPSTATKQDDAFANSAESDTHSPEESESDAAEETANGLENLEAELSKLVNDIEPEQPLTEDVTESSGKGRPVDIATDEPESNVDHSLSELEAELTNLNALAEEPAGPVTNDTESEITVAAQGGNSDEAASPTLETASDTPTDESPATPPVVIAEIESDTEVPDAPNTGVGTVSTPGPPEVSPSLDSNNEIQVAENPDQELSIPAIASSDDKLVDDEFDSVLSSYKDKHQLDTSQTSAGESSPMSDAAGVNDKDSRNYTKMPITVLIGTLTFLDKPFESLSKETKEIIGAAAVVTCIMTMIAMIILLYLQ